MAEKVLIDNKSRGRKYEPLATKLRNQALRTQNPDAFYDEHIIPTLTKAAKQGKTRYMVAVSYGEIENNRINCGILDVYIGTVRSNTDNEFIRRIIELANSDGFKCEYVTADTSRPYLDFDWQ